MSRSRSCPSDTGYYGSGCDTNDLPASIPGPRSTRSEQHMRHISRPTTRGRRHNLRLLSRSGRGLGPEQDPGGLLDIAVTVYHGRRGGTEADEHPERQQTPPRQPPHPVAQIALQPPGEPEPVRGGGVQLQRGRAADSHTGRGRAGVRPRRVAAFLDAIAAAASGPPEPWRSRRSPWCSCGTSRRPPTRQHDGAVRELIGVPVGNLHGGWPSWRRSLGCNCCCAHHARGCADRGWSRLYAELRGFLQHSSDLAESGAAAGEAVVGELAVAASTRWAPFRLPGLLASFHDSATPGPGGPWWRVSTRDQAGRCAPGSAAGADVRLRLREESTTVVDTCRPTCWWPPPPLAARDPAEVGCASLAGGRWCAGLPHSSQYLGPCLRWRVSSRSFGIFSARFRDGTRDGAHGHGFALAQPAAPAHELTYDGSRVGEPRAARTRWNR